MPEDPRYATALKATTKIWASGAAQTADELQALVQTWWEQNCEGTPEPGEIKDLVVSWIEQTIGTAGQAKQNQAATLVDGLSSPSDAPLSVLPSSRKGGALLCVKARRHRPEGLCLWLVGRRLPSACPNLECLSPRRSWWPIQAPFVRRNRVPSLANCSLMSYCMYMDVLLYVRG